MKVSANIDLAVQHQPCPLCGGNTFEVLARHDRHLLGLVTVGCKGCGLAQTNPRPDAAGLATFYAQHYRLLYQGVVDPSDRYIAEYRESERLSYTVAHLKHVLALKVDSVLLDYGCGEGSLFAALRAHGYGGRLAGVEPNPNFARYAAEVGQADVRASIDGFEQLDAVVVNHALEHLADPVGVLRDIQRRLKPDGCLYIDVPDADRYAHVGDLHLAHILHFTHGTLTATVQQAGFDVVSCEPHEPPHHPLSLRLLARPSVAPATGTLACSVDREISTWRHLRALESRSWRWTVSRRLAQVGALRRAYAAWRRWRQASEQRLRA